MGLFAAAVVFLAVAITGALWTEPKFKADPGNPGQVARGQAVYTRYCASCHGARLDGQPNWQQRLPSGRMPAPPHDDSGHTWHHPDPVLFGITRHGVVPGKYAPPQYQSDMPAFDGNLSDEAIWAVLAYIKSWWSPKIRDAQRQATLESRGR